jgi:hypothetical protein
MQYVWLFLFIALSIMFFSLAEKHLGRRLFEGLLFLVAGYAMVRWFLEVLKGLIGQ